MINYDKSPRITLERTWDSHICQELFQVVDNDGDGSLTQEEFINALSLPNVQRYLTLLDVRIQDPDRHHGDLSWNNLWIGVLKNFFS